MTQLAQRMFDANVRTETMFWLGSVCAAPSRDFQDFIEQELTDASEIHGSLPWTKGWHGDAEDFLSDCAAKSINGFIVELATPIPDDFHKSGYSFSWGYYQTRWFFFRSLEEMTTGAEAFQREVVKTARKKQKPQKTAATAIRNRKSGARE